MGRTYSPLSNVYKTSPTTVVVITWMLILDTGCWTWDFASLDCTTWINPQLQAMAWW
jgi:hypothetical protein